MSRLFAMVSPRLLFPLPVTHTTLFDCQSPISTVSPSFSRQLVLRRGKAGTPVAVVTAMGVFLVFSTSSLDLSMLFMV